MPRSITRILTLLAFIVLTLSSAQADTLTYNGDTFVNPTGTFNRPVESGASLSVLATNVAFSSFNFTVTAAGSYSFLSTSLEPVNFDPFLILYTSAFNPASPLSGFVIADDEVATGSRTQSGFTTSLAVGTAYSLVTAGRSNFDAGRFTNVINGPGVIVPGTTAEPIPEPATMLLLGTGLAGISAAVRRKRKAK